MQIVPTQYPDINSLLVQLQSTMQQALGDKLVGLYLHGSLVIGDFDPARSDIDLLAVLSSDVDEEDFATLQDMHEAFAQIHKEWENRIEVCYVSAVSLHTVKTWTSTVVNISPGEPLNRREAAKHWLVHWYILREKGVTLLGPSPKAFIEPISQDDFVQAVREHTKQWNVWIEESNRQGYIAYAILTLCRALYTCRYGEQVSKKLAGMWVQKEFPAWSSFVQTALAWREAGRDGVVDEATIQMVRRFIRFVISECEGTPSEKGKSGMENLD